MALHICIQHIRVTVKLHSALTGGNEMLLHCPRWFEQITLIIVTIVSPFRKIMDD